MRIYNEVVLQWDDKTQQFNTLYEDSEEYSGEVILAQGSLPNNATAISAQDTIADTLKSTTGYFTDGDGTLQGNQVFTASLSDSNKIYYFSVNHKVPTDSTSETQFSVAFGHIAGSGSDQYGDSTTNPATIIGSTQAIYKQWTNRLLTPEDALDGFKISAQGTTAKAATRDDYVYILVGKREKFKERMNKKSWTLVLSGSNTLNSSGSTLVLTDDSLDVPAVSTVAGPRYNIVSGALGDVKTPYTTKTYGWFYPDRGVMIFSGAELSASIPGGDTYPSGGIYNNSITASYGSRYISGSSVTAGGTSFTSLYNVGDNIEISSGSIQEDGTYSVYRQQFRIVGVQTNPEVITASAPWHGSIGNAVSNSLFCTASLKGTRISDITASFGTEGAARFSSSGFAPNLTAKGDPKNALKFVNCLRNNGTQNTFRLRSEQDQSQESFFCRINANQYNFSSNHTWVSGSYNKIRHTDMHGNPQTYITGVGLYNSAGQLLAVAELSKPLRKNFTSEATIKVKLTY